jgi:hypothetical protein
MRLPCPSTHRTYKKDVPVTTRSLNGNESTRLYERTIDEQTQSFEVEVYTAQELEHFRELSIDYRSLRRRLGMDPSNSRLLKEIREIQLEIAYTFGADVWILDSPLPAIATDDDGSGNAIPIESKTGMRLRE